MAEPTDFCAPSNAYPDPSAQSLLPDNGPQLLGGRLDAFCAQFWDPNLMTGALIDLIRQLFSAPQNLRYKVLRAYIWNGDPQVTKIAIESNTAWTPELVNRRPSVVVGRNEYESMKLGLGDLAGRDRHFQNEYATAWVGSHTIYCGAGTGAMADHLSGEVIRYLTRFGPVLRDVFKLLKFRITNVGKVAQLPGTAAQTWCTPVTLAWVMVEGWRVEEKEPILSSVRITANTLEGR